MAGRGILVTRAIQQWGQHLHPRKWQRDEQEANIMDEASTRQNPFFRITGKVGTSTKVTAKPYRDSAGFSVVFC